MRPRCGAELPAAAAGDYRDVMAARRYALLLIALLLAGCEREAPVWQPPGLREPAPEHANPQAIALEQRPEIARVVCDAEQRIVALFFQRALVTDAVLELAAEVETLETLDLVETKITDAACGTLARLKNLRTLHLKQTAISDAGLAELAALPNLRELSLARTAVSDAGCVSLARLESLEELALDDTGVTDAGLAALARLPRLTHLSLVNTPVTDAGVARLQSARPALHVVR